MHRTLPDLHFKFSVSLFKNHDHPQTLGRPISIYTDQLTIHQPFLSPRNEKTPWVTRGYRRINGGPWGLFGLFRQLLLRCSTSCIHAVTASPLWGQLKLFRFTRQLLLHCPTTIHPCIYPDEFVKHPTRVRRTNTRDSVIHKKSPRKSWA